MKKIDYVPNVDSDVTDVGNVDSIVSRMSIENKSNNGGYVDFKYLTDHIVSEPLL